MNIEQLNRQRNKFYRNYLKQEIGKSSQNKKLQNSYLWKVQHPDQNQLIDRLNQADQQRLQHRRHTSLLLQQHNTSIGGLRKSKPNFDDVSQSQLKHASFTDDIHKVDAFRNTKQRQDHLHQNYQNSQQNQIKRYLEDQQRSIKRGEQFNHMRRIKQIQDTSEKNYEQNKRKHSQNMSLYRMHKDLVNENSEMKKQIEKFTETEKDIINPLYRNQSEIRRKNNINLQGIIKKQMDEFNTKKINEKQATTEGHDLEKSLFKNILHHESYDRKQYADYLKGQMEQENMKKSYEKLSIKQKNPIHGVFGGEHSHERKNQIRYVNMKMGVPDKYSSSMSNQEQQKMLPRISYNNQSNAKYYQPNSSASLRNSVEKQHGTTRSINQSSKDAQKGKDTHSIDKEFNKSGFSNQISEHGYKQAQNIIDRGQGINNPYNQRYFKSYDLISGKNKLYANSQI